jgi:hypothetical protein
VYSPEEIAAIKKEIEELENALPRWADTGIRKIIEDRIKALRQKLESAA